MDEGLATMIFMGLILKIPIVAAIWLLWWAVKSESDPAEAAEDEGGNDRNHYRREPKRPRNPRRGPHAPDALPLPCPEGEGKLRVTRRPGITRVPDAGAHERR